MDDHELVRVVAAKGCAQILSDHWQDMPSHHLTTLLTTLCCELTHDMGSPEVVVAALQVPRVPSGLCGTRGLVWYKVVCVVQGGLCGTRGVVWYKVVCVVRSGFVVQGGLCGTRWFVWYKVVCVVQGGGVVWYKVVCVVRSGLCGTRGFVWYKVVCVVQGGLCGTRGVVWYKVVYRLCDIGADRIKKLQLDRTGSGSKNQVGRIGPDPDLSRKKLIS